MLKKAYERGIHRWLGGWVRDRAAKRLRRSGAARGPRHLLFSICDHYEPLHGGASMETGIERVRAWRTRYPALAERWRDADGRPPRHSYFYPGDQYDPRLVEPIAEMCALGWGDVEVHLHHTDDTRASLQKKLEDTLRDLAKHQVVSMKDGRPAWAFIHGDWALANPRRDGKKCGVDDELVLLQELGCYADFTFPSAPDESQPGVVNCIYYPDGDLTKKRAYEAGRPARVGTPRRNQVLLLQGPLAPCRRPGARHPFDVWIENTALDWSRGASLERLRTWVAQEVRVEGRPEWLFVKVYAHGAPERNAEVMLGDAMHAFHADLLREYNDGTRWKTHYVTAREMYNVARAAMDGHAGDPAAWFDYEVPPAARAACSPKITT